MQKHETGPLFYTIAKIQTKCIQDLNIRPKTVKLLEHIGKKFHGLCLCSEFSWYNTKSTAKKAKIDKSDYIKVKHFYSKGSNQWSEKTIYENLWNVRTYLQIIYQTGVNFQMYKKLLQLNSKKPNNPIEKCAKGLKRHFSKDLHMTNSYMKRHPASHKSSRKWKLKLLLNITPQLLEWLWWKRQKQVLVKIWRNRIHCKLLVGVQHGTVNLDNSIEVSQKVKNRTTIWFSNSTSECISKESKSVSQRGISTPLFTAALFTIVKIRKQPKCSLMNEQIKKIWFVHTIKYYSGFQKKERNPAICDSMDETWGYYDK